MKAVLLFTALLVACALAADQAFTGTYSAAAGAANPLRGFAQYDSDSEDHAANPSKATDNKELYDLFKLEFFYIPFKQLWPSENKFDWAPITTKLAAAQKRKHQVVLRPYIDLPWNCEEKASDIVDGIPKWMETRAKVKFTSYVIDDPNSSEWLGVKCP